MTTGVNSPSRAPAKVPATPKMPNTKATRTSTLPRRQWSMAESVAVTPTTPKLMAMADFGSTCNKYISAGNAMMEPPLPNRPNTMPVAKPARIAKMSMICT